MANLNDTVGAVAADVPPQPTRFVLITTLNENKITGFILNKFFFMIALSPLFELVLPPVDLHFIIHVFLLPHKILQLGSNSENVV
jgi:hypothetical protein